MKRATLFCLSMLVCGGLAAQYDNDFGIKIGAANYLGEMGGKEDARRDFVYDLKMSQTSFSAGAYFRTRASYNLYWNNAFTYGRIQGDDALSSNPGRVGRNLSFRNDIYEVSSRLEYRFYRANDVGRYGRYLVSFNSYVFGGLAGFYHAPKASLNGEWYDLRSLKTEGQINPYGKISAAVPLGAGFNFTYKKHYRIGMEVGWRTTFTDYLDDVSTNYATDEALGNDPIAIALANRHNEIIEDEDVPAANNYEAGEKRGDAEHNDSYIFASVNAGYVFRTNSNHYKSVRSDWRKWKRETNYRGGGGYNGNRKGGGSKWRRYNRDMKVKYRKRHTGNKKRKNLFGGR